MTMAVPLGPSAPPSFVAPCTSKKTSLGAGIRKKQLNWAI